ncbi:MAG: pyrimidine-nucleoside phosphorylase [Ruminococcus sp.]|jgi:pyrimidine-nucleoside phosphorylase
MRMYDLIEKKRDGCALTSEEIRYMVEGYVKERIPDYQMAAMLMAIYLRGMTDEELSVLTDQMAHSGEMVDLSSIPGVKVDKHSTGGVGDKTTLIACPIAAACGVKVAKMSGRGLGHTGGTVDKLEAIPGYQTSVERKQFLEIVKKCGISVIGQSGNLAPADKKMYALRDVTATVESIPLIAASIMSKKLAAGSDCILLDVKTGSGAFMKKAEDAVVLAQKMAAIGSHAGKKVAALITDMDVPLGNCIGNSLEVLEAAETLKGKGPEDLKDLCVELAAQMILLAGEGSLEICREKARKAIADGSAFKTLQTMVQAHGGDSRVLDDPDRLDKAPCTMEVKAPEKGRILHMDTHQCGMAACMLGAGRETKEDEIDYSAGIVLKKKTGCVVEKGETLAVLHTSKKELLEPAASRFLKAVTVGTTGEVKKKPLILARVDDETVEWYR